MPATQAEAARCKDALMIQEGACNPRAIVGTLARHMSLMADADTPTLRNDPALRLMVHQLAFLFNTGALDSDPLAYTDAFNHCHKVVDEAG